MSVNNQTIFGEAQIDADAIYTTDATIEDLTIQPSNTDGQVFQILNVAGTTTLLTANTSTGKIALPQLTPSLLVATDASKNLVSTTANYVQAPSGLTTGQHIIATGSSSVGNSVSMSEDGTGVITINKPLVVKSGSTILFNVNESPGAGVTKIAQCLVQSPGVDGDAILQVLTTGGTNVLDCNTSTNIVTTNQLDTTYLQTTGAVNFGYPGSVKFANNYTYWQPEADGEIIDVYTSNGATKVMALDTNTQTLTVQNAAINGSLSLGSLSLTNLTVTGTANLTGTTNTHTILPSTNLTYNLGSSSDYWSTGYIGTLYSPIIYNNGLTTIQPGSDGLCFDVKNAAGTLNLFTIDTTGSINTSLNYLPFTNNTGTVGSASKFLNGVYSTNLNGTAVSSYITGSSLTTGKHLVATGSNTIANSSNLSESGTTTTLIGTTFLLNNTSTTMIPASDGAVLSVYNNGASTNMFNVNTSTGVTTANKLNGTNLTASTALVTDASKNIISSATTATQIGYLSNVTSDVQTQLNGKQPALSGLTSGKHIVATGASTIGNSSILSESGTTLTSAGSIVPSATTTYNLGTSSVVWNNIYGANIWASTAGYSSYGGYVLMGYNNGGTAQDTVYCANSRPLNNNSVNCGTSSNYWNSTYTNNLYVAGMTPLNGAAGLTCNGNFLPQTNGTGSLGLNGQKWSNLWTTSNAQIGGSIGFSGQTTWDTNMTIQSPNLIYTQGRCPGWNTYSSIKYKENIKDLKSCLDTVMKLKPRSFTWKKGQFDNIDGYTPQTHFGFIAQEVNQHIPQAVTLDADDNGGMDYAKLIVWTVGAIQEQQVIIEKQQKQIETLLGHINHLSERVFELEARQCPMGLCPKVEYYLDNKLMN